MSARQDADLSLAQVERQARRIKRRTQFMDTVPMPSAPMAEINHDAESFLVLLLFTVVGLVVLFVAGVIFLASRVH
jgi:hypothetical protein